MRQTRIVAEFGDALRALMDGAGVQSTYALSEATSGKISPSYAQQLVKGRVPSYEVLEELRATFGTNARPLYEIAGYPWPGSIASADALRDNLTKIADQRGLPVGDVVDTLIREELSRLSR